MRSRCTGDRTNLWNHFAETLRESFSRALTSSVVGWSGLKVRKDFDDVQGPEAWDATRCRGTSHLTVASNGRRHDATLQAIEVQIGSRW